MIQKLPFIISLLLVCSCFQKNKKENQLITNKKTYHLGDTLSFSNNFDSIMIIHNEQNFRDKILIDPVNFNFGYNNIDVLAYKNGSEIKSKEKVVVLSNLKEKSLSFKLINSYYHNPQLFTEGFQLFNNEIYESSGLYGKSKIVSYKLGNTQYNKEYTVNNKYFAEGLVVVKDKIYILTWKEKKILILDKNSFKLIEEIKLPAEIGEGWGLTYNNNVFYISNGSENIYLLDNQFNIKQKIQIVDSEKVYNNVNELEFFENNIYANVWQKDIILKINPKNGQVIGILDLKDYQSSEKMRGGEVLNGIAFSSDNNLLFTGKNWSKIYEIKIIN